MGSPLSPIMADLVLQDFEDKALKALKFEIPIYYRYVDDILLSVPLTITTETVNMFNSFHLRLQFTLEREKDRCISFLDLLLRITNNKVIIDWFHKDTFSERYLSFFSHHPRCHKIGTICTLIDKAIMLSNLSFWQKNLEFCINILLDNGYSLDLVLHEINNRLKEHFNNQVELTDSQNNQAKTESQRIKKK
ncbi:uncharacterized protein LOC118644314 [Monomorium pharaonis]|uniref:uncharacterized protein LOC118644314 n=1 Tax=Monomorium pharaonis TaxID=307658 RepID=UPI00174760C1|nr:uncharacterized protein LOC118644314 [Monomorium pharaonis]